MYASRKLGVGWPFVCGKVKNNRGAQALVQLDQVASTFESYDWVIWMLRCLWGKKNSCTLNSLVGLCLYIYINQSASRSSLFFNICINYILCHLFTEIQGNCPLHIIYLYIVTRAAHCKSKSRI